MRDELSDLTVASIVAAASDVLTHAGYHRVAKGTDAEWATTDARVFEDVYSVVAVSVFDSWHELEIGWPDAQGSLVELMTGYVPQRESKSWDGYLVLLTPAFAGLDERAAAQHIERDTSRVRKLVATGYQLHTIDDVERTLLPLLPIATGTLPPVLQVEVLDMLPELVSRHGVPREMIEALVKAFTAQEPLLERLHEHRRET